MKLFIVQPDRGGIPDEPEVYLVEAEADKAFAAYCTELHYDPEDWGAYVEDLVRYWTIEVEVEK